MVDLQGKVYWKTLTVIAIIKLSTHLAVNTLSPFGLHRDEYLYLAEADHLAWGFMEVPPLTPFLGMLTKVFFGTGEAAIRFFPALAGVATIYLTGMLAKELGGKRTAQAIAATAILISPAFLGINNLFQPVSFNQMWWLVMAYLSVRIINDQSQNNILWYMLGISLGLAVLTKYSVAFFVLSLLGAILISSHRKRLMDKGFLYAILLALAISLPNIFWQINLDFPVIRHMTDLAATQLVNVQLSDFLIPQFLFHFGCTLIWISGLYFVLVDKGMKKFRYIGTAYILVFILVMSLDGKPYYIFGAYPMLYASGGVAWEKWMGRLSWIPTGVMLLLNLVVIPYGLPVLSPQKFISFAGMMKDKYGVDAPLRWEDGSTRPLRQDFADMLGWEEIPEKVAAFYHSLSPEERSNTMIQGGSYGHAGVLNLRRKQYNLPEAISLNSGFIAWAPDTISFDRQIFVDDRKQTTSPYFNKVELIDSISNPYARDPGYIYYRYDPKVDVQEAWKEIVKERKKIAGILK